MPIVGVAPRVWYNPELRSTLFLVPGLIAYISMITAVVSTALSIVREKETRHDGAGAHGADLDAGVRHRQDAAVSRALADSALLVILAAMVLFDLPMRGSWLDAVDRAGAVSGRRAGHRAAGLDDRRHAADGVSGGDADRVSADVHAVRASSFRSRACRSSLQYITTIVPARYFLVALRGIVLKGLGSARRCGRRSPRSSIYAVVGARAVGRRGWRADETAHPHPHVEGVPGAAADAAAASASSSIAPILQLTMLGYAATTDVKHVPIVVVDGDRIAAQPRSSSSGSPRRRTSRSWASELESARTSTTIWRTGGAWLAS